MLSAGPLLAQCRVIFKRTGILYDSIAETHTASGQFCSQYLLGGDAGISENTIFMIDNGSLEMLQSEELVLSLQYFWDKVFSVSCKILQDRVFVQTQLLPPPFI